jgi:puromycin-sensitive aminopeptidase
MFYFLINSFFSINQLITYREIALLIDPKYSSMSTRQRTATIVAHELAHQWFGNLVVCD